jgi:hypothetical protein
MFPPAPIACQKHLWRYRRVLPVALDTGGGLVQFFRGQNIDKFIVSSHASVCRYQVTLSSRQ